MLGRENRSYKININKVDHKFEKSVKRNLSLIRFQEIIVNNIENT